MEKKIINPTTDYTCENIYKNKCMMIFIFKLYGYTSLFIYVHMKNVYILS